MGEELLVDGVDSTQTCIVCGGDVVAESGTTLDGAASVEIPEFVESICVKQIHEDVYIGFHPNGEE